MDTNLILFTYNFPHKKSLRGMQLVKSYGLKNVGVIASPKVKLDIRQSKNRINVTEKEIINPSTLAEHYGWRTLIAHHNSEEAISFYKKLKPTFGIIFGARILSKNVIDSFSNGIINFHPGVLPENRGLDNLKWAIYNNLPQGVTTHLIDENIDVGQQIYKEFIDLDLEDTIFDVNSKIFDLQMMHLDRLLQENFNIKHLESLKSQYKSQKAVSDQIDNEIFNNFENYKNKYSKILELYSK